MNGPVVKTSTGTVQGIEQNGVVAFYGIPYAASPVGRLRFALPVPHTTWSGTRDSTQPGPTAPQFVRAFPLIDMSPIVGNGWMRGDDYLTANVWTRNTESKGLPVMVFLHGGAFSLGSSNAPVSDGTQFARSGVVCISLNYRVGIEGFLVAPGIPLNLVLHDVIAGLRWVQENVSGFGGDAENVTIFGESSGAMMIGLLLASSVSKGLFRRAILQSGHASMFRPVEVGLRVSNRLAELLGVTADAQGFASTSVEDCVGALQTIAQPTTVVNLCSENGFDPLFGISKISPVVDGEFVVESPLTALMRGCARDVDVLVGSNREEMNLYLVPTGVRKTLTAAAAVAVLSSSLARADQVLEAYGLLDPATSAGDVFCEAMHDLVFRTSARRLALAHQGRTHVYEFGWRSSACGGELGACHGLELPFVFKTLATCTGAAGIAGENPPMELSESIHALWVQFAKNGSLPWPEFVAGRRAVYALDQDMWEHEPPMKAEAFLPAQ